MSLVQFLINFVTKSNMKTTNNMKKGMKETFPSKKAMMKHEASESKSVRAKEEKVGEKDYVKGKVVKHK